MNNSFLSPNPSPGIPVPSQRNNFGEPPRLPSLPYVPSKQLVGEVGAKGYKISVRSVRNYAGKSPMCVRLMVVEEGVSSSQWTFNTRYHDESAPNDDRNPYNPGMKNRLDEGG
jgi:hypothetical protein